MEGVIFRGEINAATKEARGVKKSRLNRRTRKSPRQRARASVLYRNLFDELHAVGLETHHLARIPRE